MIMNVAAEINIQTLDYLRKRDFANAIKASSAAIVLHRTHEASTRIKNCCSFTPQDCCCIDECMLLSQPDRNKANTRRAFIYEYGISLPLTVADSSIVTPILIFNSAIAHQLWAESHHWRAGTESVKSLQKAKRLYELAYETLLDVDENVLFQFAIINNISVVDRAIGNTVQSIQYFEYLLSVFMLLVDQGCSERLQHVEGFLLNQTLALDNAAAA